MNSLITGLIVVIITFPGVVIRQLARQLFCYYYGIPVFKVSYFRLWPPGGVVVHEQPNSPLIGMILIMGPALVNTLLGLVIGAPAILGLLTSDDTVIVSCLDLFLVWLGVSIAVHSFPTFKDAGEVRDSMTAGRNPKWVQAVGLPLSSLMYMGAIGSIIWLDVIYALIVVVGMPILLFEILRMAF